MLYLMHRGKLDCPGGVLLSSYLIVLLVLLAVIIGTVSAIVCVSMKGKDEAFLLDTFSFFFFKAELSLVAQLVKNPLAMREDLGSIPGLGRSPGEGKGYPLQYSSLENSRDSTVHGVAKSWT